MESQQAVDLGYQAATTVLMLCAPVLLVVLLVGLVVGLLQAATQVQEQAVAFVPKLVAAVAVLTLLLPWMLEQMVQYSRDLITNIPQML
jgi:flagellar biosynthetic protein FliQ